MDFTEIFNNVWFWIVSFVTGGGLSVALTIGLNLWHKASILKAIVAALNSFKKENSAKEVAEMTLEQIKSVNISQNIQPIVMSEIKKAWEVAFEDFKVELIKSQKRYADLVNCFDKFAVYFENAYGVPESAKEELREAINNAKNDIEGEQTTQIQVVIAEKEENVVKEQNLTSEPKSVKVSR